MKTSSPLRRALLTATVATLAAAAPAAADSISYLKAGDIWLTTPDGARQFQVTSTGDYSFASQADDGTFIARVSTSENLRRLDRYGNVLAEFATPVSDGPTPPGQTTNYFEGPYDPAISPDGTKVAYTYYWQHYTYDPTGCGGSGCMANRLESGTAISHADRLTPWSEFGNLTGWIEPAWHGDETLIRANAGVPMAENVVVNRIAPGLGDDELTRWFREAYHDERRDAEVDPTGSKLALVDEVAGEPGSFTVKEGVRVYDITDAGFGAPPVGCFRWGGEETSDRFYSPTWSPDGSHLAFEENGDLMVLPVPNLDGDNCKAPDVGAGRLLSGAELPDWGPADVPTSRPVTPAPPAPGGDGRTPVTDPPAGGGQPGGPVLSASAARTRLAVALRKGLKVRVGAPAAGRIGVVARKRGKVVGRGSARTTRAGSETVKLRFTAKGRKALRGLRKASLNVTVTFTPASGDEVTRALRVTLKR